MEASNAHSRACVFAPHALWIGPSVPHPCMLHGACGVRWMWAPRDNARLCSRERGVFAFARVQTMYFNNMACVHYRLRKYHAVRECS